MNYYARYLTDPAKDTSKLVYMTYTNGTAQTPSGPDPIPLEGATIGLNIGNLETALTAKAPLHNPTFTGTVSGVSKSMVGLGNVDNTADADKPISTATQEALTALNTTVNNQGTTLANKADAATLQDDYYTKTEVDLSLIHI